MSAPTWRDDDQMRAYMQDHGYDLIETASGDLSVYEHYYGGADDTGPDRHVIARIPKDGSGSIAFYRYWDVMP